MISLCEPGPTRNFQHTSLNFYAEHHGKGRNDGAFGLQRYWVSQWAREHTINSLEDMRKGIQHGMEQTMLLDPPPHGPSYSVHAFSPPKPSVIRKLDVSVNKFRIEYSYCVACARFAGDRVTAKNLVFSDRVIGDTIEPLSCLEVKTDPEWRISFRKETPEKYAINAELLRRRYEVQSSINPLATRREPYLAQLLRRERQAAKLQSKHRRTKAILAVDLEVEDASESSDSSSESTD